MAPPFTIYAALGKLPGCSEPVFSILNRVLDVIGTIPENGYKHLA